VVITSPLPPAPTHVGGVRLRFFLSHILRSLSDTEVPRPRIIPHESLGPHHAIAHTARSCPSPDDLPLSDDDVAMGGLDSSRDARRGTWPTPDSSEPPSAAGSRRSSAIIPAEREGGAPGQAEQSG
jgi:hypothetical protein